MGRSRVELQTARFLSFLSLLPAGDLWWARVSVTVLGLPDSGMLRCERAWTRWRVWRRVRQREWQRVCPARSSFSLLLSSGSGIPVWVPGLVLGAAYLLHSQ